MKNLSKLLTSAAVIASLSFSAWAHEGGHGDDQKNQNQETVVEFKDSNITLTNPRVRAAKKGQNSAAFVTIKNTCKDGCSIVSAKSPVANIIELHTSFEENGVHKMRPVKSIDVAGSSATNLKPGGYHVMLIDLKEDLNGGKVPVTLELSSGETITASYDVQTIKKHCCGCKGKKTKA